MRHNTSFKAGDTVIIRNWDDMEEEYGMNEYGSIACKFTFTDAMEEYCGHQAIIDEVLDDGEVWFEKDSMLDYMEDYHWSTDMIKHVDDDDSSPPDIDMDGFMSVLFG